jgi:hypothetical protein
MYTGLKEGLYQLLSQNLVMQGNCTEFRWDKCSLQGSFVVVLSYCVVTYPVNYKYLDLNLKLFQ